MKQTKSTFGTIGNVKLAEARDRECPGQLPRAIGTEVEKDYGIAVLDRGYRFGVFTHDRNRLDELIRNASFV